MLHKPKDKQAGRLREIGSLGVQLVCFVGLFPNKFRAFPSKFYCFPQLPMCRGGWFIDLVLSMHFQGLEQL